VVQCANGREALAALASLRPDVVLLDIQMPGLSGFDVLAQVPRDSLPMVIFVTAYERHAIRAFEARAVDYLLKPVDDARFAAALDSVRERIRARSAADQRDRLAR
jgi:two-component system LytT family response regulator